MPSRFCRTCNSKPAKERLCKVHHKNVRKQQKDFATYTRNINVKTAEVGFCNVRPNMIQCINSRERFLQGRMQCKFSRRRIQHVMQRGVLIQWNIEIGSLSYQNSKNLCIFWRISENRNIVRQKNFVF